MTRNQKIIVGAAAILIAAVILIITGVIPGLQTTEELVGAKLTIWGPPDQRAAFSALATAYAQSNRNASITYKEVPAETYERDLINALAAGHGPDIFLFQNDWLPKHFDKITPLPAKKLSINAFRDLFPRVVEQDFAPAGTIYALPLYVDSLALIYNKDIFDNKALAAPPATWPEALNAILKIREIKKGEIKLAGAAIGGSADGIDRATDLLSLLMLQTGTPMVDQSFNRANFAMLGVQALTFYTQFANAQNKYYTWNDRLSDSLTAFAEGRVAMIFNYAASLRAIKEKSPFMRIGLAPMPQSSKDGQRLDYPSYAGLAVSSQSQASSAAWDFIVAATTDPKLSSLYLQTAKRPPALRSLIGASLDDENFGVFARQALTARSWPQIDSVAIGAIFSDMIKEINNGSLSVADALAKAESAVNALMAKR